MKSLFIAISLAACLSSCRQSAPGTFDYEKLNYDSNRIILFKWDTTKYAFPGNSVPTRLTREDLVFCDSMLQDAIDTFNRYMSPRIYEVFDRKVAIDSFIIKKEKYRYQYFPFEDVNGHRRLSIIGFSTGFQRWKTEVYKPKIHSGMDMLEMGIDLTLKSSTSLRSGYF